MDPDVGTSHGKQSWLRWDCSSAASLIVFGALVYLVWVNLSFRAGASASVSKR